MTKKLDSNIIICKLNIIRILSKLGDIMKFPKYYLMLFKDIYNHLYEGFYDDKIHCFLCGSNDMQFRNSLKRKLENKDIKVIYAENLFEAIVNNESKENHLDLEDILASNVELILIILEGPGALVELGMFSNDSNHIKKLIVLMDKKYKEAESFINYGPIKKIKMQDEISRVFYYSKKEDGTNEINTYQDREISKSFKLYKSKQLGTREKHALDIVTMYYFLQIAFFILNPIDINELSILLKYLCREEKIDITDNQIEINMTSAIYWLRKENYITKIDDEVYKLTKEGLLDIQFELYKIFGTKLIDSYRVQALNYQLRIKGKIS